MENSIILKNDYCEIRRTSNFIAHIHYTTTELELKDYLKIIEFAKQNSEAFNGLYLLSTQVKHFSISAETWDYMKEHASKYDFMKANAIVINDLPQRIMAKMYMMFNKNTTPTKVFSNKSSAIGWLNLKVEMDQRK